LEVGALDNLKIWQKTYDMIKYGNQCIIQFPKAERYALGSEIKQSMYKILLKGTANNYNLISSNNCMGKAVVIEGGTGNSAWGNKFDNTDDLP